MLIWYCGLVSDAAAVWQWKRSRIDSGFFAPKRSFMIFAYTRRTARNFAISSKKSAWQTKKNASRGANSSTCMPVLRHLLDVGDQVAHRERHLVAAASDPASEMW